MLSGFLLFHHTDGHKSCVMSRMAMALLVIKELCVVSSEQLVYCLSEPCWIKFTFPSTHFPTYTNRGVQINKSQAGQVYFHIDPCSSGLSNMDIQVQRNRRHWFTWLFVKLSEKENCRLFKCFSSASYLFQLCVGTHAVVRPLSVFFFSCLI